MQNALDIVGPNPPPALGSVSPTAVNDVPPPLPPGYHGNESQDSGGTLNKVGYRGVQLMSGIGTVVLRGCVWT